MLGEGLGPQFYTITQFWAFLQNLTVSTPNKGLLCCTEMLMFMGWAGKARGCKGYVMHDYLKWLCVVLFHAPPPLSGISQKCGSRSTCSITKSKNRLSWKTFYRSSSPNPEFLGIPVDCTIFWRILDTTLVIMEVTHLVILTIYSFCSVCVKFVVYLQF